MADFLGPVVEFRLLGPFEVLVDGRPRTIGSPKQRLLLAMLTLRVNRVVPVDILVDGLWGEAPPASVKTTLQSLVSRLRQTLGEAGDVALRAEAGGYRLAADPASVDMCRFEQLMAEGRRWLTSGEPDRAAAAFEAGLALWRGPALAGLADEAFARIDAERLDEARRAATEELAGVELALGRGEDAVARLEPFVATHPLRESAWGLLMLALYRCGRQADALRAYQRLRATLVEELGVDPTPAVRRLEEQILLQDPELEETPTHPAWSGSPLPVPLTGFIGRARELAALEQRQRRTRLLTLTGPGGAGKTRLAVELARGPLAGVPNGVCLVDLAPVGSPDLVALTVAAALRVATSGVGATPEALEERLVEHLRPRRALLLLDNCEHLVVAVAGLVELLLRRCPQLAVVATSRELLGVPGEVVWPVPPLSLPPAGAANPGQLSGSDAVALLCARAPGDFALTPVNAPAVAEICRRLDGIPLALELAAARLRHMSAQQVAARLDDRFRLLGRGATTRTVTARHQTLRDAMDWSHALLSPGEQLTLRRLAVFPAGFGLDGAEAVAAIGEGDVLDRLAQLVDKSLVTADSRGAEVRYRLLETVRAYGLEELARAGEEETARRRHRDHYLAMVRPDHAAWFCGAIWAERPLAATAEYPNMRAALEWSLAAGDNESSLQLTAGLWAYWLLNGLDLEGSGWIARAVADSSRPPTSVGGAESLLGLAILSVSAGRALAAEAAALAEEALGVALSLGGPSVPRAHAVLSELALAGGDLVAAQALGELALSGCDALQMTAGRGWSHQRLGWVAMTRGDARAARAHFEQAADVGRKAPDLLTAEGLTAHGLAALAPLVAASGEGERALVLAAEAVAAARRLGLRQVVVMALVRSAEAALLAARPDRAEPVVREALRLLGETGARAWVADAVECWAMSCEAKGRAEAAARLLGACDSVRSTLGERPAGHRPIAEEARRCHDRLTRTLGADRFAARRAAGACTPLAEAAAYALAETGTGDRGGT